MELHNETPFAVQLAPAWDEQGADVLLIAVKATYLLHSNPSLLSAQLPVQTEHVHLGEVGQSSLLAVPELVLPTGGTDVVLLGDAWAPGGRPRACVQTELRIGQRRKALRVWGERVWRAYSLGWASRAKPFLRTPLIYERAFGGTSTADGASLSSHPHNPIGCGFRGHRSRSAMRGTPLPSVEHAERPEGPACEWPAAGYGFVPPHWPSRRRYAGTYDSEWQRARAPFLPRDFDRRFLRVGPAELYAEQPCQGGELVTLQHLSKHGFLQFRLPQHALSLQSRQNAFAPVPLHLEMVLLEPSQGRFCLLWRGAAPCDKRLLHTRQLALRMA